MLNITRSSGPRALVLVVLVAAGAVAAAWFGAFSRKPVAQPDPEATELIPDPPPPDPRLTFPTAFRNVKPGVRYVGDAACTNCHPKISVDYHSHPMGRSAAFTPNAPGLEKYDAAAHNPFRSGPFTLRVEQTPAGVVHRVGANDAAGQPLPDYAATAHLAIGSGTRGRSYLSIEGGAAWQTPISWYTSESRWDLSPGFDLGNGGRRAITPECLFCHVDRVEPVPVSVNRYREPLLAQQVSIGCERCHGPGELHVAERTAGLAARAPDTTLVNPRHLPPALQSAVCEQCHLQGQERIPRRGRDVFEYRPGLPFEQFVTVFTRHPDLADPHKSVGQFEQMELSQCFAGSAGKMVCTSCHDPHGVPAAADRDRFYRARCLTCHGDKGCSLPPPERKAKDDSCIACHMPRAGSSNIPHASVTDHRILRRPADPKPPRGLAPGTPPLVAFRAGKYAPPPEERERDLGIVLARLADRLPPNARLARQTMAEMAADRLTASLDRWRGDADAWAALALTRAARGETAEQLDAAENAARLDPESEVTQSQLAQAALAAERYDVAIGAATRVAAANPTAVEPLLTRATAYVRLRDWEKGERDARAALRIHPLHPQGRLLLAVCLHHRGRPDAGRREADTAAGLATSPQQRTAMLDWYRWETR